MLIKYQSKLVSIQNKIGRALAELHQTKETELSQMLLFLINVV